jgi:G3E family GTPase
MTPQARYIMIGGFLGAGKTTAVSRLARHLTGRQLRVGLITNDQGRELVDTRMLKSQGFATEEIPGGCFCCRFNSLVEAASKLTRETQPEVFIAEPVGSCTDLAATVTYPLRRMYGEAYSIAPVSTLVDPVRAQRVLGLREGGSFSSKVAYIYRKQLEEADLIVINKIDLLGASDRLELSGALAREFQQARILEVSCRTGAGLEEWFAQIDAREQAIRATMQVDYDTYAEGEALLGWLNATIQVTAPEGIDSDDLLGSLSRALQRRLCDAGAEIAHLKMTLSPDEALGGEVAVINLVRNDVVPELSQRLDEEVTAGQLILNLRAEADPVLLEGWLAEALGQLSSDCPGLALRVEHLEHFRPGRPTPTHRDTVVAGV